MLADDKIVEYMYHTKKSEGSQRVNNRIQSQKGAVDKSFITFWTSLEEVEEELLPRKNQYRLQIRSQNLHLWSP